MGLSKWWEGGRHRTIVSDTFLRRCDDVGEATARCTLVRDRCRRILLSNYGTFLRPGVMVNRVRQTALSSLMRNTFLIPGLMWGTIKPGTPVRQAYIVHPQTPGMFGKGTVTHNPFLVLSVICIFIIQICSGFTHGRVPNGEFYAQKLQTLIYLDLSTDCFMKISLHP